MKQTDFDGQFSYSDIKPVEFYKEEFIKIYPTLVNETLIIETNAISKNGLIALIVDSNGKVLRSYNILENKSKKEIFLGDLVPGNYFITILNNNTLQTHKFVKL